MLMQSFNRITLRNIDLLPGNTLYDLTNTVDLGVKVGATNSLSSTALNFLLLLK